MARLTRFSRPMQNGLQVLIRDIVASYPYLVRELMELQETTALSVKNRQNGMPRGGAISDSTGRLATDKAMLMPELRRKINAINMARETTDEEFREAVWAYTVRHMGGPEIVHKYAISESTLQREKNWFFKKVAYLLNYWTPGNPIEQQWIEQDLQKKGRTYNEQN